MLVQLVVKDEDHEGHRLDVWHPLFYSKHHETGGYQTNQGTNAHQLVIRKL